MEKRRKASYQDDEKADRNPERRSSGDDEQEQKAHARRKGSHRDSESGPKTSDKGKGLHHEDESREKAAQWILKRWKGQHNANANTPLSIGLNTALRAGDRGRNYTKGGGMW